MDVFPVRVLIVEDEPSVRFSLAGFLEDFNFEKVTKIEYIRVLETSVVVK